MRLHPKMRSCVAGFVAAGIAAILLVACSSSPSTSSSSTSTTGSSTTGFEPRHGVVDNEFSPLQTQLLLGGHPGRGSRRPRAVGDTGSPRQRHRRRGPRLRVLWAVLAHSHHPEHGSARHRPGGGGQGSRCLDLVQQLQVLVPGPCLAISGYGDQAFFDGGPH